MAKRIPFVRRRSPLTFHWWIYFCEKKTQYKSIRIWLPKKVIIKPRNSRISHAKGWASAVVATQVDTVSVFTATPKADITTSKMILIIAPTTTPRSVFPSKLRPEIFDGVFIILSSLLLSSWAIFCGRRFIFPPSMEGISNCIHEVNSFIVSITSE